MPRNCFFGHIPHFKPPHVLRCSSRLVRCIPFLTPYLNRRVMNSRFLNIRFSVPLCTDHSSHTKTIGILTGDSLESEHKSTSNRTYSSTILLTLLTTYFYISFLFFLHLALTPSCESYKVFSCIRVIYSPITACICLNSHQQNIQ